MREAHKPRSALLALLPALALAILLAGCTMITPLPGPTPESGLPNPASAYCQEQGGTLDIRSDDAGNQFGVCVFADGSECDEWAFYRGECAPGDQTAGFESHQAAVVLPNPASVYCQEQGGTLDIRSDDAGNQFGVCVFADGSECDEWAFYRGECAPGDQAPAPAAGEEPAAMDADSTALAAAAQAQLPDGAYDGVRAMPLTVSADSPALWAVYSTGRRNYDLDPVPGHFVAIHAREDGGWQELARLELDAQSMRGDPLIDYGPDFVPIDGVAQVEIDPSRIWLTVDGAAGAHSGTFQVLSFDGETLRQEVGGGSSSPGMGTIVDVNGDGQNDVILDISERYVFCYACGVAHPYFQVYTWLGDEMLQVDISGLMMGQRGTPPYQPNGEAVELARAGLWVDALAKIQEAGELAGEDDPPTPVGSLRWNQALIQLNHDAHRQAVQESAYPLLNLVFYGDHAGAVDLMRPLSLEEIFSPETPLIKGTIAEGWKEALSNNILDSATAAITAKPDLAPAYFLRAWAEFLAEPASRQVRGDLARAAFLAPEDPLFAAAAGFNPAPNPTQAASSAEEPVPITFRSGATSTIVGGALTANSVQRYVLPGLEGQTLQVAVAAPSNAVALGLEGADGTMIVPLEDGLSQWEGILPSTQDYVISLTTPGPGVGTGYTMRVTVAPLSE